MIPRTSNELVLSIVSVFALLAGPSALAQEAEREPTTCVLLVTIDALRADRLGCYGYAAAHTPRFDALAARGVRFERAYTHVPLTLPAHASLLSGRTPLETGLHDDGRDALGPEPSLLAEAFRARGYRTGAFVSSLELDSAFGLARGFDVYDDDLGAPDDLKALKRTRPARDVVRAAAEWLLAEKERPFFCWVQFSDPRAPYKPPYEVQKQVEDPYDGEIAHVDACIAGLVEAVRSLGAEERTLVVLAGSTGESLGDHGEATHGALLNESAVRVPLVIAFPGRVAQGRASPSLVAHADVAPTLMELLGWPAPEGATGRSFAAALAVGAGEGAEQDPHAVYLESEYAARCFGWSTLRALVEQRWKYVHSPAPALYDLAADPGETRDLAAEEPKVAARLRAALEARVASGRKHAAQAIPLDTPEVASLAAIDTEPPAGARPGELPEGEGVNPAERIECLSLYREAQEQCYLGQPLAMVEPLEKAVAASPDTAILHTLLAIAYERSRRFEEALAQLELALELDPRSSTANYYMARLQIETGHPESAEAYYQLAAELGPDSYRSQLAMALRLVGEERFEEALPHLRRVCELRPKQPLYWEQYTAILRSARQWVELERALGTAAVSCPDNELYFRNFLAWVLATCPDQAVRDPERAVVIARELALQTEMRDAGVIDTLSAALAADGQFEEAQETAAKGILIAHQMKVEPLLSEMRARLELYRSRKPYLDQP